MLGSLTPGMMKESGLTMLTKRLYLALICVLVDAIQVDTLSMHLAQRQKQDTFLQK